MGDKQQIRALIETWASFPDATPSPDGAAQS
jgi:hypothetical protein